MSSPSDLPDSSDLISQAVAADATAAHAVEGAHHHSAGNSHCQNCGTPLRGPFCHRCGQHDFDVNRSFWHTFLEALESFLHFDTKLFRGLITLLFCPGRLTAAFNAGKRSSQMPPFRLYVFVSIFFFLFASLKSDSNKLPAEIQTQGVDTAAIAKNDTVRRETWKAIADGSIKDPEVQERLKKLVTEDEAETPVAEDTAPASEEPVAPYALPIDKDTSEQLKSKIRRGTTPEGRAAMAHGFFSALPKLILLCLPLFALYTRFLFHKSKQVYLQHLVLALHYHTFIYLWLMFEEGWTRLFGLVSPTAASWVEEVGDLWMLVYPVLMLRYVFANSWWKTLVKTGLLTGIYAITLGLGFIITATILLLTL